MTPHKKQMGFTLLELLIAMVIVSLVMTSAFSALRIGSRSWEAGQKRTDAIEEMRSYTEFLRRQVAQTVVVSWEDESGKRIAFSGRQQSFRFIAPAPSYADTIGLLAYSLMVDKDPGASRLRLEYEPYNPGATAFDEAPGMNAVATAMTFDSASFDYFGAIEKDGTESWYPEWPAAAELFPTLVRITFDAGDDAIAWPNLVLSLHARPAQ